jgi:branched-chain amino acid transport system substrate-binding protein
MSNDILHSDILHSDILPRLKFARVCALAAVCALLASCAAPAFHQAAPDRGATSPAPPAPVKIGVFEPLSGADKDYGELEKAGIELAHRLYPEVLGRPIELVVADNRSDIGRAAAAAQTLVEKGVSVALGSYRSTLSIAGGDVFSASGIPAIAITNGNPIVTNTNDYYFRVRHVEAFQGVAVAKYAVEELGASKAAVMREIDNDYAAALCQSFSDKFTALAGDPDAIAYTSDYPPGTVDFTAELARVKAAGAEAVFIPAEAGTAIMISAQAEAAGLEAMLLGTDLWESEAMLSVTNASILNRMAFSSDYGQGAAQSDLAYEFAGAYAAEFGEGSEPDHAAALGFDAYMLARDAISRAGAGATPGAIRDALAETKSFPGASGNITFDENGDPIKSVPIMRPMDGKFVRIYTAEPNWAPLEPAPE